METLPYFLVIGLIIGFSVLTFGIKAYNDIDSADKIETLNGFVSQTNNKIKVLSSMSIGSFDYVYLNTNSVVTIYKNGTLVSNGRSYEIKGDIHCIKGNSQCNNKLVLFPGNYKILLYHGWNTNAKYCICFT